MRLLIALAFVALASAMPEPVELPAPEPVSAPETVDPPAPKPVELPTPGMPSVTDQSKKVVPVVAEATSAKAEASPSTASATPETIKVKTPVTTVESTPEAIKESPKPTVVTTAKVVQNFQYPIVSDVPRLHKQDLPLNDPEAIRKLFPNPMDLVDIRPLLVPLEVMRQVAQKARATQELNVVNVGGAHPFSFENAEPLNSVPHVNVVDTPTDQLDAKMNPLLLVETPGVPETVRVVDISDQHLIDMTRPLPSETWRGPPQNQIPRENWRIPAQILGNIPNIPLHYRPVPPPYYRTAVPGYMHNRLPKYYNYPLLR